MANDDTRFQMRRGSRSNLDGETPREGEPTFSNDSTHVGGFGRVGDGSTAGGVYAGAGNAHPGGPVNRWIHPPSSLLAAGTASMSANILLFMPVCIPPDSAPRIKNIGLHVQGAGGGSDNVRLGLYRNEDGVPTDLVLDSGNLSVSSTGFKQMGSASPLDVRPGWYWTAFVASAATATYEVLSTTGYLPLVPWSSSSAKRSTVQYQIHAFAALPSTASPLGVSNGAFPLVHLQIG